jgi:hypothetical protein
MSNMYSTDEIAEAARRRGHTEEEIARVIEGIARLRQHGLLKTARGGTSVGLTRAGRIKVAELRATGQLPPR